MRIISIDYVILLKGWWWTVMDDVAEGAHTMRGSTDESCCSVKWVWLDSLVFSCIWIVWLSYFYTNMYPHATAVDTYIWFEWDVIMFVRIVRQMKRIDFEKYLFDIKQDDSMRIMNIDHVIFLKGWWWTVMDDVAEGAHTMGGSSEGWCCSVKWVWLDSFVFPCIWIVWLSYFYPNMYPTCNCNKHVHVNLYN